MRVDERWFPAVFLVMFAVGCGTARPLMPVPESLKQTSSVMTVERHGWGIGPKPLSFGEWDVIGYHKNKRPRVRHHKIGIEPVTYAWMNGFAAYSFTLAPNGRDAWECYCEQRRSRQEFGVGTVESSLEVELKYNESLDCELQRHGDEEVWQFQILGSRAIGGEGYRGTLTQGTRSLILEAKHAFANLTNVPGPPTGYIFEREGAKIASTELFEPGFVRIADEAGEDRDLIATAAAALLMQPGPL